MSDYIVLVKQVPDVTQITDNAFNPDTGTLIRSKLENVINDLDAQALAFAHHMRAISGDSAARIIALSMGPAMAADVLRYTLARCADQAVLLTDRALSGADTVATADPLACAIRRVAREFLNNSDDYFIVTGMQSVDGDTAQVPAQIAEELGIGCIAYVTEAEFHTGQFEFRRIVSGGNQVVRTRRKPVVITVAKYEYPLFAGFERSRRARLAPLVTWGAKELNARQMGGQGSKTQVIRVFPPGKTNRKCHEVKEVSELGAAIVRSLQNQAASASSAAESEARYLLPGRRSSNFDRSFEALAKDNAGYRALRQKLEQLGIHELYDIDQEQRDKIIAGIGGDFREKAIEEMLEGLKVFEPHHKGDVWIVAEESADAIIAATFELIGKGRELADSLETQVGVVCAGASCARYSPELIAAGADTIYLIEHPLLADFDPTVHRKAVADAISAHWPQIVLFAATPRGRVLAPMVSYRLSCGLTADCTGLEVRDQSRKGQIAILLQTRPALGGNVMATICTKDSRSQMATARPGIMRRLPPDPARTGTVITHAVQLSVEDQSLEFVRTEQAAGKVDFGAAVIVSGGKGLQNRDNYEQLLDGLCTALKSRLSLGVEKGASRAAVEQGFAERARQVGQTGTAVGPKLYLALGISGAIQHMIGVANTETIVAVNNDPHAPILKQCDYYLVGDVERVVPQLISILAGK